MWRWFSMRFAVLMAIILPATPAQAELSTFANLDTLLYDGLVFVGGTDKREYAYVESIRVVFVLENPTGASYFWFPLIVCHGAGLGELWCPSPGSPVNECVPVTRDDRQYNIGTRPRVIEILPGRHVFYEAEVPPFQDSVIPPGWCFRSAHVVFDFPYQPPYEWAQTIPYTRQGLTPVDDQSWTAIKLLYRE